MKSKKAESGGMGFELLVKLITGILLFIIIVGALVYFNITGTLSDLIPRFSKTYLPIQWAGEEFLEHPEIIAYHINGGESDMYVRYLKVDGDMLLQWRNDKIAKKITDPGIPIGQGPFHRGVIGNPFSRTPIFWIAVNDKGNPYYNALNERDKAFVDALSANENTPEKVLEIVVNRVRENNEGNRVFDVSLDVYFNKESNPREKYNAGNRLLGDLDGLIIKFNQITRGIVKVQ